jgi:hypothetical protein
MHQDDRIPTASNPDGEYLPAGEAQGNGKTFEAGAIATAFDVDIARVEQGIAGEFGLGSDATVDSRAAQHLAEVILGDQVQDVRQAALMRLGAFTPRTDHDWGFGEKASGEESDRLVRNADTGDESRG